MTKELARKQRELIRSFDRDRFTYTGEIPWLAAGIIAFFGLLFCIVPMEQESEMLGVHAICSGLMAFSILYPYLWANYQNQPQPKNCKVSEILQYLPVSVQQIRQVRIEYLWKFLWKYSLAALGVQIFSSCVLQCLSVRTILYVVLSALVLPMTIGVLLVYSCD